MYFQNSTPLFKVRSDNTQIRKRSWCFFWRPPWRPPGGRQPQRDPNFGGPQRAAKALTSRKVAAPDSKFSFLTFDVFLTKLQPLMKVMLLPSLICMYAPKIGHICLVFLRLQRSQKSWIFENEGYIF